MYLCFCEPANLYVAIHSDPDRHPDTVDYEQEEDGVADVREKHTERVAGLDRGHYHRQGVRDEEEEQKPHVGQRLCNQIDPGGGPHRLPAPYQDREDVPDDSNNDENSTED